MTTLCTVCERHGIETPATRKAVDIAYCDACAQVAEGYLLPGERLEDMTEKEIDHRIYS